VKDLQSGEVGASVATFIVTMALFVSPALWLLHSPGQDHLIARSRPPRSHPARRRWQLVP
jgi:hypothetical protein